MIFLEIAGVNTQMDLNFEKVNVNSTPMDGKDVFSYVPVNVGLPGEYINYTKGNIDSAARTSIIWTDGNQSVINQTEEWEQNQHLNFTIGTIRIKETWETTFRFKVNQTGLIQLFGEGSSISYNGNEGTLKLPNTSILSITNITPLHLGTGSVDISDLKTTSSTSIDSIPFQWNLTYTGSFTATETILYSYNNGPWVVSDTRTNGPISNVVHSDQLNIQGINEGTYRIKVHVDTPDAGSDEMIIGTPPLGTKSPNLLLK